MLSSTLPRLKREGGISLETPQRKRASSRGGENFLVFLELWEETWGSSRVITGTSGTHSCCVRKLKSPCELQGASWDSSPLDGGA